MTTLKKGNDLPAEQSKLIEYPVRFIVGAIDLYVRIATLAVALALAGSFIYALVYLPLAWIVKYLISVFGA